MITIDFSRCSNNDVAELLFACWEPCGWLCKTQGYGEGICYCKPYTLAICPASIIGREDDYVLCEMHYDKKITKPEIARQCLLELDRRKWSKAKFDADTRPDDVRTRESEEGV